MKTENHYHSDKWDRLYELYISLICGIAFLAFPLAVFDMCVHVREIRNQAPELWPRWGFYYNPGSNAVVFVNSSDIRYSHNYTVAVKEQPLVAVLNNLSSQGLYWYMPEELVDDSNHFRKVTIPAQSPRNIQEILNEIFRQEPNLRFECNNGIYVIRSSNVSFVNDHAKLPNLARQELVSCRKYINVPAKGLL